MSSTDNLNAKKQRMTPKTAWYSLKRIVLNMKVTRRLKGWSNFTKKSSNWRNGNTKKRCMRTMSGTKNFFIKRKNKKNASKCVLPSCTWFKIKILRNFKSVSNLKSKLKILRLSNFNGRKSCFRKRIKSLAKSLKTKLGNRSNGLRTKTKKNLSVSST